MKDKKVGEKMKIIYQIMVIYIFIVNIVAFALMKIDKEKAKRNQYRISEKTLFMSALIGGSIGSIAGMYTFRHKTKHWYFVVGMPAILFLQIALVIFLLIVV